MNDLSMLKAVFLGALQGATEFLPVSSSGHLVIAQGLMGVKLENGGLLAFDVCLHFGTLLAIVAVFWRELVQMVRSLVRLRPSDEPYVPTGLSMREARRLALLLIVGTIPAGVLGVLFKDFFESLFSSVEAAAAMLLVTGVILWFTRYARSRDIGLSRMTWMQAILIGVAQAIAIIPGISRSGSTIAGGLYQGMERASAARFAFLLAVPAIGGAGILQIKDLASVSSEILWSIVVGTLVSFLVGIAAIKWLLGVVRRGRFSWFAYYCWAAGLATLAYLTWLQ